MESSSRTYSVIVVTMNNADGLQRTLQSIRRLDYPHIETIVINGGSDAETLQLLHDNGDIISSSVSERDSGIYNAMNKGIRLIHGDYAVFMNAGDAFAHSGVLSVVSGYEGDLLLGGETYGGEVRMVKPQMTLYDILSIGINHQAVYYRSEVLRQFPFDESYRVCADLKSVIEPLAKGAASVACIPQVLAVCEGGGLSQKRWRDALAERQRIITEVVSPLYRHDYLLFSRINNGMIGDFIVLSHFRSIFPLVRGLARIMRFLNDRFKHIPLS